MIAPLLATLALVLAGPPPAPPATDRQEPPAAERKEPPAAERPRPAAEDDAVIDDLELLQQLELLEAMELLDDGADERSGREAR